MANQAGIAEQSRAAELYKFGLKLEWKQGWKKHVSSVAVCVRGKSRQCIDFVCCLCVSVWWWWVGYFGSLCRWLNVT